MFDLVSEVRAHIHAYRQIRQVSPDLAANDPFFRGTLEGASSLARVVGGLVRDYRRESALEAAMEDAAQALDERREAAGRRAEKALLAVRDILTRIEEETGEPAEFHAPSYSVKLNPDGAVELGGKAGKPAHERSGAKKIEALYLRRLEVLAEIDQIKAEEKLLAEKRRGLLSEASRIDQDVMEEIPSLLDGGKKTLKLPMVNITLKNLGRGVVVTDETVLDDRYLVHPPPPPPKVNAPAILSDLIQGVDVLGAHLDNGRQTLAYAAKESS